MIGSTTERISAHKQQETVLTCKNTIWANNQKAY